MNLGLLSTYNFSFIIITSIPGSFVTIRRRQKYTYDAVKSIHSKCNVITANQDKLASELAEVKELLKRLACNTDMESVDLQPFFPCSSNETILEFMSNRDGNYEKRRKAFESFLYSIATSNNSKKRLFSDALFHSLFARNYILSHVWPCKG